MNSEEALKYYFGYSSFRNGQKEIIDTILSGRNVLAVLPTGAGKSLCYQIPAMVGNSFSIVISPLIALMKDQVDSLNKNNTLAAFINSSLDFYETEKVLMELENNRLKILYLSPEKLSNRGFTERIKLMKPEYIFVDEAHCISEWGHNFRPSYRKIRDFIQFCEIQKVSAFTATATEEVRKDIIQQLGLENINLFVKGFERENLAIKILSTRFKKEKTLELIKQNEQPMIIYTATRKNAEEIADFLRRNKLNTAYYHAGLSSELKRIVQDDFISGRTKIIAATNAFGMGIDKSDIRTVIHYNMPGSIENYYQEIGRAGRDGEVSNIFLLYDERDREIQQYFIDSSFPTRNQIEIVYDAICDYGKIALGHVNQKEIVIDQQLKNLFDLKELTASIVESSLKVLDESGYLLLNSNLEKKHYLRIPLKPDQLRSFIQKFANQENKDLLLMVAREYGATVFTSRTAINISKICELLDATEQEIISDLKGLTSGGIIEYEEPVTGVTIKLIQTRIPSKELRLNLQQMEKVKISMKKKLNEMIEFTRTNECRFKYILTYFGQETLNYNCGKCDVCLGDIPQPSQLGNYLEEIILQTIHESTTPIRRKNLFQILTGKTDNNSLRKFSTFGSCSHFKKPELESAVESLVRVNKLSAGGDSLWNSEEGQNTIIEKETSDKEEGEHQFEDELKLFNKLRQNRKEASEKFGQVPQLICPDEILRKIAQQKPQSHSELLSIDGFSQRMFNKIGEEFLNILNTFQHENNSKLNQAKQKMPPAIKQIYDLVQKKYSLEDVAKLCRLSEQLTAIQIESLIEQFPEFDISTLIDAETISRIEEKINLGITELKELRESLGSKISYSKIRIVLTKKRVS